MPRILVLLALFSCGHGQDLYVDTGLLAEIFAPLYPADTCLKNGSLGIFENRVPNIVKQVNQLNYQGRSTFDMDRCAWELNDQGNIRYECRGQEELYKYFAARYTGYIYIFAEGYYNFQLDADDGARLIVGHSDCASGHDRALSCADRYNVTNFKFWELRKTNVPDSSYAKHCSQCQMGIYVDCWVTHYGCEPFSLWQLEADGGLSGQCGTGPRSVNSTRWLNTGLHPIRIEYFQRGGPGSLIWRYRGPDTDNKLIVVPQNKLQFPRHGGFTKDVFDATIVDPIALPPKNKFGAPYDKATLLYRADDLFQNTGPDDAAAANSLSKEVEALDRPLYIRWQGLFEIFEAGQYTFKITSDDGGRFVLGGRGYGGEQVVLDSDGIKEGAKIVETTLGVLRGFHPVRIDYFYKPDLNAGVVGVPRPPGVKIEYSGPDTGGGWDSLSKFNARYLALYDYSCEMRRFSWGNGMSVSRDCGGACFKDAESVVGDRKCDDGTGGTNRLNCFEYNYDNGDCDPDYQLIPRTTPRPMVECQVSCLPGDWKKKNCGCSKLSRDGTNCLESYDNTCPGRRQDCTFLRCCVAKVRGVNFWGEDCLAFGTTTNCTYELERVLDNLQTVELPLDARAVYDPFKPRRRPTGELMVDCNKAGCNNITKAFKLNPFTNMLTTNRVCPVQEVEDGISCWDGPFEVTDVTDVMSQCQSGSFEWNFCQNRKTIDGRPFKKCCNFLYQNPQGAMNCRFMGIAQGTCRQTLDELARNLSTSDYTRITSTTVMNECTDNLCNNPMNEYDGCPNVVDKTPEITDFLRPTIEPDLKTILKGAKQAPPVPPPWGLIGGLASLPFLLVCFAMILMRVLREPAEPVYHTSKAKVVAHDTFIEPQQDNFKEPSLQGLAYGKVEPRPFALRNLLDERKVVVAALQQPPENAVPEATNAAWADTIAFEASLVKPQPGEVLDFPPVAQGTTYSGEGRVVPLEKITKAAILAPSSRATSEGHQALSTVGSALQSRGGTSLRGTSIGSRSGSRGPPSSGMRRLTSSDSDSRSVLSDSAYSHSGHPLSLAGIEDYDDESDGGIVYGADLPEPPTEVVLPEIGYVEPSISGLALNQVSVGNLHRPAAVAKMMRRQAAGNGIPQIAT